MCQCCLQCLEPILTFDHVDDLPRYVMVRE